MSHDQKLESGVDRADPGRPAKKFDFACEVITLFDKVR